MAERDVLVVDDDRQFTEILRTIFSLAGYNCLLASDGYEGLEVFRKARPPLVVTDLRHPGINGIELLRQVRALDGDVAVIVLTGAASVKTAIECLKSGAYAFLMKPINMDELLITVERALERRQLLIEHGEHQKGQLQEAQPSVLIVEQNRQVRDVFHRIFFAAGYKCLLASDGGEGLEVFHRSRPALVVTDLNLLVMSGSELLQKVRQEDPDAAVIVIASALVKQQGQTVGYVGVKTQIACLKHGAYAFLMKPINMDELLIVAERALERRQLLIERREHERPESQEGT